MRVGVSDVERLRKSSAPPAAKRKSTRIGGRAIIFRSMNDRIPHALFVGDALVRVGTLAAPREPWAVPLASCSR